MTQAFFRVDGNREIGTGHLSRCHLLARKLQVEKVPSTFLISETDRLLLERLEREGFGVEVLRGQNAVEADAILGRITCRRSENTLLVVDSSLPNFYTLDFQQHIRQGGVRLMIITFRHDCHFISDIVHNQSLLALGQRYSAAPYTRLLLGPRYTILDDAFYNVAKKQIKDASLPVETIFLSFGGADNFNLTLKGLTALSTMREPPQRIIVAVGVLYNSLDELKKFISKNSSLNIQLHINTSEISSLMAQSNIALTSGGLTIWELACLGIPNIIISTSERERQHSLILEKMGQCYYLGHYDHVSHEQIAQAITRLMSERERRSLMSQKSKKLVDGLGWKRVLKHITAVLREA